MNPGERFADLDLPDHTGRPRRLSELAGGDPVALFTSRGWWCPKEQRYMRGLCRLQDEFEVAYARIVVVSVDLPEVQSAFRAGLGARFTFLSDAERRWLPRLGLLETTDTVHHPYLPAAFTLCPACASTAPTTATGTSAGRPTTSCGATCARSRWRSGRTGRRRRHEAVCLPRLRRDSAEPRSARPGTAAPNRLALRGGRAGARRIRTFARLLPGTVVRSDVFCQVPPPAGPPIERCAGAPWPRGSFQ